VELGKASTNGQNSFMALVYKQDLKRATASLDISFATLMQGLGVDSMAKSL
jgi:hypothetical protein